MYRVPPGEWTLPEAYDRPPLMAIGDGLLSGMRSFSMTDALAALSIPALLADALVEPAARERFRRARYPAPVLLDVEATFAALPDDIVAAFAGRGTVHSAITANLRGWLARFSAPAHESVPLMLDALAISGADDVDVYEESAEGFGATAAAFAVLASAEPPRPLEWSVPFPREAAPRSDAEGRSRALAAFADLHVAIPARHLLNPCNDPALRSLRAIDHVALRRPRLLLHCLGQSSGLFDITLRAEPERGLAGLACYAARWPARAEMLAALPQEVERVVVLLLPLPSRVPNLMPPPGRAAATSGHGDRIVPGLHMPRPGGPHGYSGAELARIDAAVRGINADIATAARKAFARIPERLLLADPWLAGGEAVTVTDANGTRRYTNHGFAHYRGGGEGSAGGLSGLDNHHPTTVGARVLASALASAIAETLPGVLDPSRIALTDAADTLLAAPPPLAMRVFRELHASPNPLPEGAFAALFQAALAGLVRLMMAPARP